MASDHSIAAQNVDLRDYTRILVQRRWVIAATTVLAVALAITYSLVTPPQYTASASVLIPEQQAGSVLNVSNSQLPQAQSQARFLADEQNFAEGDAVKELAEKTLGHPAKVGVGSSTTADLLTFTSTSRSRVEAASIANAFANSYISARRANQIAQYTQQVTALEGSIANLQQQEAAAPAGSAQAATLAQSMQALQQSVQQTQAAAQLATTYGPSVVDAAKLPSSPSAPKTVRNAVLAGLAGLLLGLIGALLLDRLDDRIRSREDAERAGLGTPVISLIPLISTWKDPASTHLALVEDPASAISEAYRTLRTSLQFLAVDEPKKVIGITSSLPGEGKSTATANLAVSFARAGMKVVVISGDLRRPHIHDFFRAPNSLGLTSVILGEISLTDALWVNPDEPGVTLLPAGYVPPNPAEILTLDRVREIVDILARRYDIVLIDCPPVLPVSDTLLLSRLVDGMLVLVSASVTSKGQLERTYELLRQVNSPLLGTVLNRVPSGSSYTYGYGYEYGYGPQSRPSLETALSTGATSSEVSAVGEESVSPSSPQSTSPVQDREFQFRESADPKANTDLSSSPLDPTIGERRTATTSLVISQVARDPAVTLTTNPQSRNDSLTHSTSSEQQVHTGSAEGNATQVRHPQARMSQPHQNRQRPRTNASPDARQPNPATDGSEGHDVGSTSSMSTPEDY